MTPERDSPTFTQLYLAGSPDKEEFGKEITETDVMSSPEFSALTSLIESVGRTIYENQSVKVVSIRCPQFQSDDSKAGLSLLANFFFGTRYPFVHTTIVENEKGRIEFLFRDKKIVSFGASKIINDPFDRAIHYVDIQATNREEAGNKYGQMLGKISLNTTLNSTTKDVVLAARTQNPKEVGLLKRSCPEEILLAPFWQNPPKQLVESVNWLVQGGAISRNSRKDNRFDATNSFINWGAYGVIGDGTTWEDMTKFDPTIRWDLPNGIAMQHYANTNGTNIQEMLFKGHAFIVGAYIKR